jgi:putative radical SAM enzyme (TIGR03279 family)
MNKTTHRIASVADGSIAQELELEPGDVILQINNQEIEDIFDYHYLVEDEYLTVLVEKPDGEQWELEIEKEEDEDLGITFENGLMDDYKSCSNKCIFCFIDQMPPGMRDTLYFKDDDSRLSFLQGNYVTLTNMKEKDIERIIRYRLDPINISVQTTNPDLRCEMLHNRFAGEALKKIDRLFDAGIRMNGQIVLCKGVNDGAELDRSIGDLMAYQPYMESVSVVPVGLSKYRDGLYPLEPFTKEDAEAVLGQIHRWQQKSMEQHQTHFIHASDEWYLLAEQELPKEENYDGYLQLENGVGMLRLLHEEFVEALEEAPGDDALRRELSIATGRLAAPFLEKLVRVLEEKYPGITVHIYPIRNEFFGEMITVSGLLTGQDLRKQLADVPLGEKLLLPCNMLRDEEQDFLDDITLEDLEKTLQVPIDIVKSSGKDLLDAILNL